MSVLENLTKWFSSWKGGPGLGYGKSKDGEFAELNCSPYAEFQEAIWYGRLPILDSASWFFYAYDHTNPFEGMNEEQTEVIQLKFLNEPMSAQSSDSVIRLTWDKCTEGGLIAVCSLDPDFEALKVWDYYRTVNEILEGRANQTAVIYVESFASGDYKEPDEAIVAGIDSIMSVDMLDEILRNGSLPEKYLTNARKRSVGRYSRFSIFRHFQKDYHEHLKAMNEQSE